MRQGLAMVLGSRPVRQPIKGVVENQQRAGTQSRVGVSDAFPRKGL